MPRAPGAILLAMFEISASVKPTWASVSGFFWRFDIIALAECPTQSASSSSILHFSTNVFSSFSFRSFGVIARDSGWYSPYARSRSTSSIECDLASGEGRRCTSRGRSVRARTNVRASGSWSFHPAARGEVGAVWEARPYCVAAPFGP